MKSPGPYESCAEDAESEAEYLPPPERRRATFRFLLEGLYGGRGGPGGDLPGTDLPPKREPSGPGHAGADREIME